MSGGEGVGKEGSAGMKKGGAETGGETEAEGDRRERGRRRHRKNGGGGDNEGTGVGIKGALLLGGDSGAVRDGTHTSPSSPRKGRMGAAKWRGEEEEDEGVDGRGNRIIFPSASSSLYSSSAPSPSSMMLVRDKKEKMRTPRKHLVSRLDISDDEDDGGLMRGEEDGEEGMEGMEEDEEDVRAEEMRIEWERNRRKSTRRRHSMIDTLSDDTSNDNTNNLNLIIPPLPLLPSTSTSSSSSFPSSSLSSSLHSSVASPSPPSSARSRSHSRSTSQSSGRLGHSPLATHRMFSSFDNRPSSAALPASFSLSSIMKRYPTFSFKPMLAYSPHPNIWWSEGRGVEEEEEAIARASLVAKQLLQWAKEGQTAPIAIVSHPHFISLTLKCLLRIPLAPTALTFDSHPSGVSRVDIADNGGVILCFVNRLDHLL
eukprot:GILI01009842.1.p1 GENE.GILI01009842.1~~GILI01009842.1.p1  ORF type:complete len:427 (-),score=87.97 GILI01009842.1:361-1641(-)